MPALQQSNWPQSNDFWANVGQHHAPSPLERRPYDTQLLDNVADKYRHKCLTALLRDCFNRQEQTYRRIAHDALLDRESEEQIMWPLHCFYLGDAPSSDAEKGSSCNPARFVLAFTDRLLLMA